MKILFINSGLAGVPAGYAASIRMTLENEFKHLVKEISPRKVTIGDIILFKPELVFVLHGNLTHLGVINFARKRGIMTVLWIIEDPYELDVHTGEWLTAYDFIFTNEREAVSYYRQKNPRANVYYLPWCTNPLIFHPRAVNEYYQSDLCFVGMGFKNRVEILNQLAGYLSSLRVKLIGNYHDWGGRLHPLLKKAVIPEIADPREIACYYSGARINLNIHRDPDDTINVNSAGLGASSLNNRTFDIAGTGGFQLIDNTRKELAHFFTIGKEIVAFDSGEELLNNIKYYLSSSEERQRIGENAYFRTVNFHTFKNRLEMVFRTIQEKGVGY